MTLLDCCRQIPPKVEKGESVAGKTAGQLYIIHAVGPGKSAVSRPDVKGISEVTGEFLRTMGDTQETFPSCIDIWVKHHRTVEVVKHMPFEFPLKEGSKPRVSSTISTKKFEDWDPSTIVEWLSTLKLTKNYKDFVLENGISGAAMIAVYKERQWAEAGFQVFGDQLVIKAAMKSILGF